MIYTCYFTFPVGTPLPGSVSDGPFLCFPALLCQRSGGIHSELATHWKGERGPGRVGDSEKPGGFSQILGGHENDKKNKSDFRMEDFRIKFEGDGVIRLVDIQSS